jgi:hypothetical protein
MIQVAIQQGPEPFWLDSGRGMLLSRAQQRFLLLYFAVYHLLYFFINSAATSVPIQKKEPACTIKNLHTIHLPDPSTWRQ